MTGTADRELKKKVVLSDGSIFTGQARRDLSKNTEEYIPDGQGKIKWPNGDKYQGAFVAGKPQGHGIKTIKATSSIIKGVFLYGMACGQGEMTRQNANGEIELSYQGEFLDDRPHGKGKEAKSDGWEYEGLFQRGKKGPSGK